MSPCKSTSSASVSLPPHPAAASSLCPLSLSAALSLSLCVFPLSLCLPLALSASPSPSVRLLPQGSISLSFNAARPTRGLVRPSSSPTPCARGRQRRAASAVLSVALLQAAEARGSTESISQSLVRSLREYPLDRTTRRFSRARPSFSVHVMSDVSALSRARGSTTTTSGRVPLSRHASRQISPTMVARQR